MSFGFSLDIKEQIRQATDIVQLAGEYVRLTPKGRGFVGLCPWHDDSSPSLQINPDRQTYRCWVCNVGGDVFSFVMKAQNVSFPEALEFLAERAGIPLPEKKPRGYGNFYTSGQRAGQTSADDAGGGTNAVDGGHAGDASSGRMEISKKTLTAASAWAEEQYHRYLMEGQSPEAEIARAYFSDREILEESLRKFKLGFAPPQWNWLEGKLTGKNASRLPVLEAAGVMGRSEKGTYYERFRGRVTFPIHDAMKRSVGMGARVIPGVQTGNEAAKYVNTPETPLFSKRKMLYALDLAMETMRKSRRVLVTEGYMDTIVAHQYGFTDTVAVLGTAVGMDHIRVLKRHADTIYLILDGDAAGQRRTLEVLGLFVAENVDVRILTLPEGMDPADFLQKNGADAFEETLRTETVDALEHAYNVYTRDVDARSVNAMEIAMENILKLMAESVRYTQKIAAEPTFREHKLLQNLAFLLRVPENILRTRLNELRAEIRRQGNRGPYYPDGGVMPGGVPAGITPGGMPQNTGHVPSFVPEKPQMKTPSRAADTDALDHFSHDEEDAPPADVLDFSEFSEKKENFEEISASPSFPPTQQPLQSDLSIKEDAVISESQQEAQEDFFSAFEHVPQGTPDPASGEFFLQNADSVDWAIYGKMDAYQQELLELLIHAPVFLPAVRRAFPTEQFTYVPARELLTRMCEMEDDGIAPTYERLLMVFESEKIQSWLVTLEENAALKYSRKSESEVEAIFAELVKGYERFQLTSRKLVNTSAFRIPDLDGEQRMSMLEELLREARKKKL